MLLEEAAMDELTTSNNQQIKKHKYRLASIRVNLIDELDLGEGVVLKVIKFIEMDSSTNEGMHNSNDAKKNS